MQMVYQSYIVDKLFYTSFIYFCLLCKLNYTQCYVGCSGVARGGRGGHLPPGAAAGGGRQNHAKEFFLIYILRNFEKSERIQ